MSNKTCPNCNSTQEGDAKFCHSCGTRLDVPVASIYAGVTTESPDVVQSEAVVYIQQQTDSGYQTAPMYAGISNENIDEDPKERTPLFMYVIITNCFLSFVLIFGSFLFYPDPYFYESLILGLILSVITFGVIKRKNGFRIAALIYAGLNAVAMILNIGSIAAMILLSLFGLQIYALMFHKPTVRLFQQEIRQATRVY